MLSAETFWRDDFNEVTDWYDNKADTSYRAVINPGKKKGTAILQQKGKGTWGKVAYVINEIDLDKYNIVRVKVKKVDLSSAYKILAISTDWSETYIVIERGNGRGIAQGNIQEATGWKGEVSFNLVLIVEGKNKKITFDWIELISKEEKKEEKEGKEVEKTKKKTKKKSKRSK